jgi:hypothetical protein
MWTDVDTCSMDPTPGLGVGFSCTPIFFPQFGKRSFGGKKRLKCSLFPTFANPAQSYPARIV